MSVTGILFSPQLIAAVIGYAFLSITGGLLSARVHARLDDGVGLWLWMHLYAPMMRAAILMVFLLMAYPTLFGLTDAPTVAVLLAGGDGRFGHLLGIVFLLSLVLPLVPALAALPALVMPIQGIAGAALLFHWLTTATGAPTVSYWPGGQVLLGIMALSWAAHWLAVRTAGAIEHMARQRLQIADLGELLIEGLLLFLQAPAIILYTMALGKQLTTPG